MFGLPINLEKRIPGLDLARSLAIFLVVFSHSLSAIGEMVDAFYGDYRCRNLFCYQWFFDRKNYLPNYSKGRFFI